MTDKPLAQPPKRPWRELAAEVLLEKDPAKVLRLAQELCDAIDEQVLQRGSDRKTGSA